MVTTQAYEPPRRRAWIYAPLVLVVLLGLVWSAFWLYAARQAETTIAAWIEREAKAGRAHSCGSRTIGGYPFRIEMHCRDLRIGLRGLAQPVVLESAGLLAVAQIYEPDLVIAELSGPMRVTINGDARYTLDWRLLRASLRGFPTTFHRASLVVDDATLTAADAAGAPLAQGRHVEMHARLRSAAGEPAFDLAARADAIRLPALPRLGEKPADGEVEAVLTGVRDLSPQPLNERLRLWQAAGGRLEITKLRVAQGEAVAIAKGEVGLSPGARLDGRLDVTLAGLEQAGALIFGESSQGRSQASLLAGLALLAGGAELEGRRAVALPLRFKDGALFLGPLPIGQVPPLY